MPWVPRAAQDGMPHPVRASQSKRPSATTAQAGAGPRRPRPSTGLGPGNAWKRGVRSGSTARPASQRTRPPEASGTTTIPANRSAPRSMNSPGVPDALLGEAEGLQGLPQPAARRVAETEAGCGDRADAPRGQVLPRFCVTPEPSGVEARRRRQEGGVAGRQRGGPRTPRSGWTSGGPGRKPWAAAQPLDGLRQREALGPLDEVQHVAALAAPEAVEPLRVAVHREASLGLVVEGADALADPAPSPETNSRRRHRVAQGVPGLQRGDVHAGRDHHPPPVRGRRPRRLRPERTLPGRQRIPSTAATSSVPPSPVGTSTAARPVPWL